MKSKPRHLPLALFSGDDGKKRVSALSGGEAARLVFSRLALENPNVLVLDEPTNHLDLESIESLVVGLNAFEGTLILVSHDRWFVRELATRIVEIKPDGILDYQGSYDEYVHYSGDDHLDADRVVLKAKRAKKKGKRDPGSRKKGQATDADPPQTAPRSRGQLEAASDKLTARMERAEARIAEIDELFCQPGYFEKTPADEISMLEKERARRGGEVDRLTEEWGKIEVELAALETTRTN
jgi:ABC-type multidrug transport system ATPase subunit